MQLPEALGHNVQAGLPRVGRRCGIRESFTQDWQFPLFGASSGKANPSLCQKGSSGAQVTRTAHRAQAMQPSALSALSPSGPSSAELPAEARGSSSPRSKGRNSRQPAEPELLRPHFGGAVGPGHLRLHGTRAPLFAISRRPLALQPARVLRVALLSPKNPPTGNPRARGK